MGLTSWKHSPDGKILKSDVSIAQNYLTSKELEFLQDIVNMYLDIAESEFEKIRIEQDKQYIFDFDRIINECKKINK